MALTLDVWDIPPESANRVQHPAPFPVELPQRLIELYTFTGDLVLDPFLGSGTTVVAARRAGRLGVGYDLDPAYVARARARLAEEEAEEEADGAGVGGVGTAGVGVGDEAVGVDSGASAATLAKDALTTAGFVDVRANRRLRGLGLVVSFTAKDAAGSTWHFDIAGTNSAFRGGMSKTDTIWRTLGRAHVMASNDVRPLVILTPRLPRVGSEGDKALRATGPKGFFDAIDLFSLGAQGRLTAYAHGGHARPLDGFWTIDDLASDLK
jgi:site-specific DNA-methyltransferase (adenine-specific)